MAKVILSIDDNRAVSRFIESTLRPLGYKVETLGDGIEGLARVIAGPVDLILVDFVMPRMNGFHFCKALEEKGLAKGVPIVLLSSAEQRVAEKMKEMTQVVDFIPKPVKAGPLKALVTRLLGSAHDEDDSTAEQTGEDEDGGGAYLDFDDLDLETSDSAIATPMDRMASLRDRLESAMANGLAAHLDRIAGAQSREEIMGIIGEAVAEVCSQELVQELVERARDYVSEDSF